MNKMRLLLAIMYAGGECQEGYSSSAEVQRI